MADYGMKVGPAGYDVKVLADRLLIMKSDFTLLKVFSQGVAPSATIAHNLGYVPQFLVYVKLTAYSPARVVMATGNMDYGIAYADTSNLYILIPPGNSGATVYYYIFYEQA